MVTINYKKILTLSLILMMVHFCEMSGKNVPVVTFSKSTKSMYFYYVNEGSVSVFKNNTNQLVWDGDDVIEESETGYKLIADQVLKVYIDTAFKNYTPDSFAFMFYGFENLTDIDGFENLNVSNTHKLTGMFSGCKSLKQIDLSNFDTSNVLEMGDMFRDCISLKTLDVSSFNTSNVMGMGYMFYNCTNLESIQGLWRFDTSNVLSMTHMFYGCESLVDLDDVMVFNTSKVKNMSEMFHSCKKATRINVSKFDTSNVTGMNCMFADAESVTSLDVSHFNTSNVTTMYAMFSGCSNLKSLNLTSFDVSKVESFASMFSSCKNLTTIICNDTWPSSSDSYNMFYRCDALTGSISYDKNKLTSEYANPDNGYFTKVRDFNFKIAGVPVTDINCRDLTGIDGVFVVGGQLFFEPETNTLVIDEADIYGGEYPAISNESNNGLTIKVGRARMLGVNNLRTTSGKAALLISAPTTIKGDKELTMLNDNGYLRAYGGADATIYLEGKESELTIEDATIIASGSNVGISGECIKTGLDEAELYGKLIIKGFSNVGVLGSTACIYNLNALEMQDHNIITTPKSAEFEIFYENNNIPWYSGVCVNKEVVKNEPVYITYTNPGDVNLDMRVDISDIVAVINTIAGDKTFRNTADVSGDSAVNITDVVEIINIISGK